MSKEEYDELDDLLLDEDPATLDAEKEQTTKRSNVEDIQEDVNAIKGENDNPEVQKMMNELQSEFANLLKQQQDGEIKEGDKETIESFKSLMGALDGASKVEADETTTQAEVDTEDPGFKNVISNTLDRLRENGSKIDKNLKEEKANDSNDILSQLLGQLADTDGNGDIDFGEDGMDNAIVNILNQMSSKEVLYVPMKEMHEEFTQWFKDHGEEEEHKSKLDNYNKQYELVDQLVKIYEREDYDNGLFREEITRILDDLEQLGDSPVNKGFNAKNGNELDDISKLLEVDGSDANFGGLDKEIAESCKQQ